MPNKVKFTISGIFPKKEPEMQRSRNVWPIIRSGGRITRSYDETFMSIRFVYYHNDNDSLVGACIGQISLNCTLYVQFTIC